MCGLPRSCAVHLTKQRFTHAYKLFRKSYKLASFAPAGRAALSCCCNPEMALIPSVAAALRAAKPVVPLPAARRAAVAVVLRSLPDNAAEILYILRQASERDPWSGQVGFPGGRRQASDADDYAAAVRECREERSTRPRPRNSKVALSSSSSPTSSHPPGGGTGARGQRDLRVPRAAP
jgi:hypothetical protein